MIPLNELTITNEEFDAPRLLAHWAWRVPQHFQPLFLSTFGDWFFRDGDDHVQMFDLVAGELKQIADSRAEFEALLELEDYRREWLMSHLVDQLRQSGMARARGQCYAFRTRCDGAQVWFDEDGPAGFDCLRIYSVARMLEPRNSLTQHFPSLLVIGGDQGSQYLGYDMSGSTPWPLVVLLPGYGTTKVADSFSELAKRYFQKTGRTVS